MRKKLFYALFIMMFTASAFAQNVERTISEVKVENNQVVSDQSILSKLKTSPGKKFLPANLSDDIKRLYATGLFNDVSAEVLGEEEVTVVFRVQEKPVLEEVIFTGNKRIGIPKLNSFLDLKQGDIFDEFRLKQDIVEIKEFYEEKGFAAANVTYAVKERENQVLVTVTVDEGQQLRIREINFNGNKAFAEERLQKLIKTRRKGWFNSGFLQEDVLEEDVDRLVGFYRSEGYIDAQVSAGVDYQENKNRIVINFLVDEGKRYQVGNVLIEGNSVVSNEVLHDTLKLDAGDIYSELKLRQDVSAIQSYYFDQGYISSSIKADTVLNTDTGKVDLSYSIIEGDVAYVDDINIEGNTRTKDVVIRRELRLVPGDRFNGEKLRRSRQRLHNLGYFEEVTFDTSEKPSTLPDKYDLNVYVKESKTGEFSFGAGYSSLDKFIGFVDLTQRNFDLFNPPNFTGAGQKLRIRTEFGSERKDYEVSFVEPWFLGYPITTGFNVYSRTRYWDEYDERRDGGNIFAGRAIGEYWYGKMIYRYEDIEISDIQPTASPEIRIEQGKNNISSVTAEITHDTRDSIYNPSTGWYNLFSYELAGGAFGGDKDFGKFYTRNDRFFSLTEKSVLELSLRLGFVDSYDESSIVPVYERFYAGGANTIRGYEERRVGPKGGNNDPIGGRLLGIFNLEYTYAIADNLKWALFYDTGNVWPGPSDFDWNNPDLKRGVGTGIRVKTPLGPIRLDYGYALDPETGESPSRFHFTMSHEF